MRKFFGLFVLCAALMMGNGLAQRQYAGVSIGNPFLQGYYGLGEGAFFDGADTRIRLGLTPLFGFGFDLGADLLFDGGTLDDEGLLGWYYGFGPGLGYYGGSLNGFGYGLFTLDVSGLGGVEYDLNDNLALFGEAGLGFGVGIVTGFDGVGSPGGFYPLFRLGLGAKFFL